MVPFRCIQHLNEICVTDVIFNQEFTWGYWSNVGLNLSRKYFSCCSVKYLFCECSLKKGNILNYTFLQVLKCSAHLRSWYYGWRMCCWYNRTLYRILVFPTSVSPVYSLLHIEQVTTYTKSLLSQVISSLR